MDWLWKPSTGKRFHRGSPVLGPFSFGCVGAGASKNNPDMRCVSDLGPILRGWYTIGSEINEAAIVTLKLTPDAANHMGSLSCLLIHADNAYRAGWAFQGCIVIKNRRKREAVPNSGDTRLEVIA